MVAIVESKSYPEKLYRFRSCKEYFLEEIRQAAHHNRILFTQIDCFPDSFELKPVVLQASDKQWIDHLRWIFDGGTAHNYARYVDNPIIANFLIPGLNSFKDLPLELIPGLVQSLRRFSVRVFRNRRRNLSAACFIKHIGSRKMWDDYGSHSAGMAFEFSVEKPWKAISEAFGEPVAYAAQAGEVSVFPMIYIEAQPDISDLDIFRETVNDPDDGKLIADNMMVSMGAKKGLTLFERQFSFKNSAYSTEEEWRLLKHTGEEKFSYHSPNLLKISRVIIGQSMEKKLQAEIVETCRGCSVAVDRVELQFGDKHSFSNLFVPRCRVPAGYAVI